MRSTETSLSLTKGYTRLVPETGEDLAFSGAVNKPCFILTAGEIAIYRLLNLNHSVTLTRLDTSSRGAESSLLGNCQLFGSLFFCSDVQKRKGLLKVCLTYTWKGLWPNTIVLKALRSSSGSSTSVNAEMMYWISVGRVSKQKVAQDCGVRCRRMRRCRGIQV
jgi:hypothetical protein